MPYDQDTSQTLPSGGLEAAIVDLMDRANADPGMSAAAYNRALRAIVFDGRGPADRLWESYRAGRPFGPRRASRGEEL